MSRHDCNAEATGGYSGRTHSRDEKTRFLQMVTDL